jgi:nucleotide-binding universal stress UspA family protein
MGTKRRSYESGHKPKCLLIVDETPESDRAVYYAARWAVRSGGTMVMLRVIETEDRNQQWLGVADVMRVEAEDEANAAFDRATARTKGLAGTAPERVIREGNPSEQILDMIEHDTDIVMLVLAAAAGAEGPGPIVVTTAKAVGTFPIPVVIVPGNLAEDEIDGLS